MPALVTRATAQHARHAQRVRVPCRYNIVEGEHALWQGVSDPYKHTIRAFLVHFHTLVLRQSSARFSFQNGSVGARPRRPWHPQPMHVRHKRIHA